MMTLVVLNVIGIVVTIISIIVGIISIKVTLESKDEDKSKRQNELEEVELEKAKVELEAKKRQRDMDLSGLTVVSRQEKPKKEKKSSPLAKGCLITLFSPLKTLLKIMSNE